MEGSGTTNQETKEYRPASKPKKTTSKKKTNQKNKKSRSVTIQIFEKTRSVKPEEWQRIVYTLTAVPLYTSSSIESY